MSSPPSRTRTSNLPFKAAFKLELAGTTCDITLSGSGNEIQLSATMVQTIDFDSTAPLSDQTSDSQSSALNIVLPLQAISTPTPEGSTATSSSSDFHRNTPHPQAQQTSLTAPGPPTVTNSNAYGSSKSTDTSSSDFTGASDSPRATHISFRPRSDMSPLICPDGSIRYPMGAPRITRKGKPRGTGASDATPAVTIRDSRQGPYSSRTKASSPAIHDSEPSAAASRGAASIDSNHLSTDARRPRTIPPVISSQPSPRSSTLEDDSGEDLS